MKKITLFIVQIAFFLLLSFVLVPKAVVAESGNACLPHFQNTEWEAETRDCLKAPLGTEGAPAGACSLTCWQQGGSWHFHCAPQANFCRRDGYTLAGGENDPTSPSGADLSAQPQNHTIQCQGCLNWMNCWKPAPSPTICPTQGPIQPNQYECRHTDPNQCGERYQLTNNGQCGTAWIPTGESCECPAGGCQPGVTQCYCTQGNACTNNPTCNQGLCQNGVCANCAPTVQKACSEPCVLDTDCNGRIGGSCTQCINNKCEVPTRCGTCTTNEECQARTDCGNACNLTTHQCYTTPPSPPTSPIPPVSTASPIPPTATPTTPSCVAGAQCTATGNECNGGVCSSINPDTGFGSCNCQGGGCVVGNPCDAPDFSPIPTPDSNNRVCYITGAGNMRARCCMVTRGVWEIDQCIPNVSPTVPPSTPTPIQPTTEITMIATPTIHPTSTPAPGVTIVPGVGGRTSQRWVCLKADPCSDPDSSCSVISDHRVKLAAKSDIADPAKPLGSKDTYVFECLQTSTGNKCTTGDSDLDTTAVGTSNLSMLENTYGYAFGGMYYENGVDVAPNPIPVEENNNGNFGAREWESYTDSNINRLFLAMNEFDPNGVGGEIGAQQQGILAFVQGGSKKCVQIKWDPYGEIRDKWTLKPVANAQVFLYQKEAGGGYSLVTDEHILSGIENPISTDNLGKYNFMVPDGAYRLEIKAPGYSVYKKDIVQTAGKQEEHSVQLLPTAGSLIQKVVEYIKTVL